MLKKKICANFQWIIELFSKKKALENMVLGSGIRDPGKTYSGSRIQGSKSTQSRIPDPQHWKNWTHKNHYFILSEMGFEMFKFRRVWFKSRSADHYHRFTVPNLQLNGSQDVKDYIHNIYRSLTFHHKMSSTTFTTYIEVWHSINF